MLWKKYLNISPQFKSINNNGVKFEIILFNILSIFLISSK